MIYDLLPTLKYQKKGKRSSVYIPPDLNNNIKMAAKKFYNSKEHFIERLLTNQLKEDTKIQYPNKENRKRIEREKLWIKIMMSSDIYEKLKNIAKQRKKKVNEYIKESLKKQLKKLGLLSS